MKQDPCPVIEEFKKSARIRFDQLDGTVKAISADVDVDFLGSIDKFSLGLAVLQSHVDHQVLVSQGKVNGSDISGDFHGELMLTQRSISDGGARNIQSLGFPAVNGKSH